MSNISNDEQRDRLVQTYSRWKMPLLRFLQRHLGNHCDAEDAMQEAFTRLATAGNAPAGHRSYLYQIAINLLRDKGRKHVAQGRVEMVPFDEFESDISTITVMGEAHCPMEVTEHRERLGRLELALAELPERQREAFVLHRFDGLTQDEVAKRMGISRRMVVKHLSRALAYCELRVRYASIEQMEALHRCKG